MPQHQQQNHTGKIWASGTAAAFSPPLTATHTPCLVHGGTGSALGAGEMVVEEETPQRRGRVRQEGEGLLV